MKIRRGRGGEGGEGKDEGEEEEKEERRRRRRSRRSRRRGGCSWSQELCLSCWERWKDGLVSPPGLQPAEDGKGWVFCFGEESRIKSRIKSRKSSTGFREMSSEENK